MNNNIIYLNNNNNNNNQNNVNKIRFSLEAREKVADLYGNIVFEGQGPWYNSFEGVTAVLDMVEQIAADNEIFNELKQKEEYNFSDAKKINLINKGIHYYKIMLKENSLRNILRNEFDNLYEIPENEVNDKITEIIHKYSPYLTQEFILEYLPPDFEYQSHPIGGKRRKVKKTRKQKRKAKKTRKCRK
jgi:hypothetical protein